jgi:hypothetical protein
VRRQRDGAAAPPRGCLRQGNVAADAATALARRYGWAALSLRDVLLAGLRDGAHLQRGWSACEWVNAFLSDRVHPSPQAYRLFADALIGLLVEAQDAEDAACGDGDADGIAVGLSRFAPMAPGAFDAPLRLCNDAAALEVRAAAGWHHAQTELVKGKLVHKPGWLATEAGSVLEFTVSTHFQGEPGGEPGANATLALTHLISYEHTGAAAVACVAGCACDGGVLQGHSVAQRVSIEATVELSVTQAQQCTIRLTVLPDTLSGEHKVKLIGVAANGPAAAAANASGNETAQQQQPAGYYA